MKVVIRHDSLNSLIESTKSAKNLSQLGEVAVKEMRLSLERGISPIRGERRLANYSESYSKAIKEGWLEFKDKRVRPVNLLLSGNMLRAITHEASRGKLQVGIWDQAMAELASYHQDGTDNMPARRFVPTEQGEQFTVTIDRALINKLQDIIKSEIR